MQTTFRDLTCGDARPEHAGRATTLAGWVHRRRDLGQLIFLDLRDRYGITQVVIDAAERPGRARRSPATSGPSSWSRCAAPSRSAARGPRTRSWPPAPSSCARPRSTILSSAKTPAFPINEPDQEADEAVRLKYRYLDLRRAPLLERMLTRSRLVSEIRRVHEAAGFVDIETPILVKSTPEGARDFIVPSRLQPGNVYALPQSPQQLKQLLMVSGLDRYYQIARCFRDEDGRGDRQPEFTQLDLEMSFVHEEDVMAFVEAMVIEVSRAVDARPTHPRGSPFPRFTYREAIDRYGTDKPDLRFGMELHRPRRAGHGQRLPRLRGGDRGRRPGRRPGRARAWPRASRSTIDELTESAKRAGGRGPGDDRGRRRAAASGRRSPSSSATTGPRRWPWPPAPTRATSCSSSPTGTSWPRRCSGACGSSSAPASGWPTPTCSPTAGSTASRCTSGTPRTGAGTPPTTPSARRSPSTSSCSTTASGDPTRPTPEDPAGRALAQQYDLALNGWELGGGSVRIHQRELLERSFSMMGHSLEGMRAKFGALLDAFEYGAPPHGGIALGIDRWAMIAQPPDEHPRGDGLPQDAVGLRPDARGALAGRASAVGRARAAIRGTTAGVAGDRAWTQPTWHDAAIGSANSMNAVCSSCRTRGTSAPRGSSPRWGFRRWPRRASGMPLPLGKVDQTVTRDELLTTSPRYRVAVDLPLNVDAERCFADDPAGVAETVTLLAEAGAAGCSIEDYDPPRQRSTTSQSLPSAWPLRQRPRIGTGSCSTAGAENALYGIDDIDDTVARLRTYRAAGADVVYAPRLTDAGGHPAHRAGDRRAGECPGRCAMVHPFRSWPSSACGGCRPAARWRALHTAPCGARRRSWSDPEPPRTRTQAMTSDDLDRAFGDGR